MCVNVTYCTKTLIKPDSRKKSHIGHISKNLSKVRSCKVKTLRNLYKFAFNKGKVKGRSTD